jgi:hypothetical protein
MVHQLYCFFCVGATCGVPLLRGAGDANQREDCASQGLFYFSVAHQQTVSGPGVFLSSDEWSICAQVTAYIYGESAD